MAWTKHIYLLVLHIRLNSCEIQSILLIVPPSEIHSFTWRYPLTKEILLHAIILLSLLLPQLGVAMLSRSLAVDEHSRVVVVLPHHLLLALHLDNLLVAAHLHLGALSVLISHLILKSLIVGIPYETLLEHILSRTTLKKRHFCLLLFSITT